MTLNTAQFEQGLAILGDLDGPAVQAALTKIGTLLQEEKEVSLSGVLAAVLPFLMAAGSIGKRRVLRRLAAVVHASPDELLEAEGDPKRMDALEVEAAKRPYRDTLQDALDFFSAFGLTLPPIPAFSALMSVIPKGLPAAAASPLSGD